MKMLSVQCGCQQETGRARQRRVESAAHRLAVRQTTGYARLRAVRVRRPAKYQCIICGSGVNVQRRNYNVGVEAILKSLAGYGTAVVPYPQVTGS